MGGKFRDLTGQPFGRLTVLQPADKKSQWKCICSCGTPHTVSADHLLRGKSKSCGCLRRELGVIAVRQLKNPYHKKFRPFEAAYLNLQRAAHARSLPIKIDYEEFLTFTTSVFCHYCAIDIIWRPFDDTRYRLDRKDNERGYEKDNVVVCCPLCNRLKGAKFSYEEWVALAPIIRRMRTS